MHAAHTHNELVHIAGSNAFYAHGPEDSVNYRGMAAAPVGRLEPHDVGMVGLGGGLACVVKGMMIGTSQAVVAAHGDNGTLGQLRIHI